MRDELRDPLRLEHIRDAILKLKEASKDESFFNLTEKDLSYFGVVKLLEIIGEAAYKLSQDFKASHPDTPWKIVVGMRHILVHGYYQINHQDVFKTIKNDLPILLNQVIAYLKEFDD